MWLVPHVIAQMVPLRNWAQKCFCIAKVSHSDDGFAPIMRMLAHVRSFGGHNNTIESATGLKMAITPARRAVRGKLKYC